MKTLCAILFVFVGLLWAQDEKLNDRFTFLQQIYFENTSGQYNSYLEEEFQTFLQKYPRFQQKDQLLWMLAEVERNDKKPLAAFIHYLKIVVVFPNSSVVPEARKKIRLILKQTKNATFLERQDAILNYTKQKHFFDSPEEATVDLYNFLFSLNIPRLQKPLLNDLQHFSRSCQPENATADILLFLKGNLNEALGHFAAAEANFREVATFYKQSFLCADALFRTAIIDYKHLHKLEEAKNNFIKIINTYPDNKEAPLAQFYLAELYVNGFDSLEAGIDNYRLFVEAFPDHPLFRKAFKRLTLLLFKARRYEEATTLIGLHLNKHANDSTFYALVDSMANVFVKKFKKYQYGARCYVLLSAVDQQSAQSPFYLYKAARIYVKYLKDIARARDICQRLRERYPDSPYAAKCRLLLKDRIKK